MRDDFSVFIMVWGRPNKMWTYQALRDQGYTGKVYFIGDDLDETIEKYKSKYKDSLIVFSKKDVQDLYDPGDNTGDLRSTMYAVNVIPGIAKNMGIKYFCILCDDYTGFVYKYDLSMSFLERRIKNLDGVFDVMISFYEQTGALTVAMAQNGDFIGGRNSALASNVRLLRKAMNSFLCSTDKPIEFVGRMNEDVTTYVNLGGRGGLFFTVPHISIIQKRTQSIEGGLTGVYLDWGTYIKSFFSVMYNPCCVKIIEMGEKHKRIHHGIKWDNAVPCIISETYRKA
jgi:hypothetical protein